MRDSAPRALRKAELHALPQRFRRILQDLTQTLRFGMQCCAYKFNPPATSVLACGKKFQIPACISGLHPYNNYSCDGDGALTDSPVAQW